MLYSRITSTGRCIREGLGATKVLSLKATSSKSASNASICSITFGNWSRGNIVPDDQPSHPFAPDFAATSSPRVQSVCLETNDMVLIRRAHSLIFFLAPVPAPIRTPNVGTSLTLCAGCAVRTRQETLRCFCFCFLGLRTNLGLRSSFKSGHVLLRRCSGSPSAGLLVFRFQVLFCACGM